MQTGRNSSTRPCSPRPATSPRATARRSSRPTRARPRRCSRTAARRSAGPTRAISESILDLPSAVVRNGRLAPDGPNFKVLVVEGDVAFSRGDLAADRDRAEARRLGQGRPADRDRRQLERADGLRPGQAGRGRPARRRWSRSCSRSRPSATSPTAPASRSRWPRSTCSATSSTARSSRSRPPTASTAPRTTTSSPTRTRRGRELRRDVRDDRPDAPCPYVADAWTRQADAGRQLQRHQRPPEDPHQPQGGPDDDPRLRP